MYITINTNLSDKENFVMFAALYSNIKEINDEHSTRIKKDIFTLLYEKINRYVLFQLNKTFPAYIERYKEDIVNASWEEIIKNFDKYNGKYTLTTFAKYHIITGARRCISEYIGINEYAFYQLNNHLDNHYKTFLSSFVTPININDINIPIKNQNDEFPDWYWKFDELERLILAYYSGIYKGLYDKRYTIHMICTDSDIITLMQNRYGNNVISFDMFKYNRFDPIQNKYIIENKKVTHVKPYEIKKILKKIQNKVKEIINIR